MKRCIACLAALLAAMQSAAAQEHDASHREADRAVIEKAASQYVEAYNKHDVAGLTALFTENAEIVTRDGERIVGVEARESAFEELFRENPAARISLTMDSLKFVTPDVAVEEGMVTSFPDGEEATVESTYRAAHVKKDGKWLIAGARTIDDRVLSNYEFLRELEWMIGKWVDEGGDALIKSTCRWSANRAFLIREFSIEVNRETFLEGVQRIGWDARTKQFRSWLFDSEGGFVEGFWTPVEGGWIVRSTGHLHDGTPVSGTTRIDRDGKDRYVMSLFNRLRGGEVMPDMEATVVRKPPLPATAAK